jgi:hypothetical protein
MNLKADLEPYRDRPQASGHAPAADRPPARLGAPAGVAINWKIVRALGLALLVWALIGAVLLSL